MTAPMDETVKNRIIAHMNRDHPESLSRFLEAYAGVSHFAARSPKLEDLTLSSLKISSAAGTKTVPLSPPLSSLSESRARLVSMHEECGRKLGRDPITVRRFRTPNTAQGLIIAGVLLGLVLFTDGSNFAPGSFLSRTLFRPVPGFARFAEKYHWQIWWVIVGLHIGEAGLMIRWLKKYNVDPLSKVWWLYVGFTALEGYGCGIRLRQEVSKERAMKEKKDGSH